ncbi:MAG: FtsW/RodA/SpoVE family cell cycle protein [Lentisphaeria bacterium]|nr:FtsW/RodA/SpoVE family cell cycle protein [Lentisphaeria bacterium]
MVKNIKLPFSFPVFAALLVSGLWGCLLIYSARVYGTEPLLIVKRQLVWLVIGMTGLFSGSLIPFRKLLAWRYYIGGFMGLLLLYTLFFGLKVNGMRGWLTLFDTCNLQPSEFAKPVFLLLCCGIAVNEKISRWKRFIYLGSTALFFWLLIILQPDFGSAFIFLAGFLIVLYLSGGSRREFLVSFGAAAIGVAAFLCWKRYPVDRIMGFLNPDSTVARSAWHLQQFRYTLAHGGIAGSEHNGALWANAYLPLPHSDSLFATIVETSGFLGGMIVICAFCVIAFVFVRYSLKQELIPEARIFIAGIALLYLTQALLHISVNVLLLPPTGITLPFLSYGGSSLCSILLSFGIAASASACIETENEITVKPEFPEE